MALLAIVLLSQAPFVVNRFRTARLASAIEGMRSARTASSDIGFRDYKGVVHVHSFLGGHSTGTFDELISAADSNGLDFVFMTEHVSDRYDTASKTLNGRHGRSLWIGGNEISTSQGDRFLVFEGFEGLAKLEASPTREFVAEVRKRGKAAVIAYPERYHSWDVGADGVEVFSLNSNAKRMNPVLFFFDAVWSYGAYPELTLARYVSRPSKDLERYDVLAKNGRPALLGGNDAHSNLGVHFGDDANNRWLDIKYDRYDMIFRVLRTHLLLPRRTELDQDTALQALRNGNSYISLDVLGDPTGFSFYARTGKGIRIMGEEAGPADAGGSGPALFAETPLKARILVLKDGKVVAEVKNGDRLEFLPRENGAYRVEVYLDSLGSPFESVPWIITNPVYVR